MKRENEEKKPLEAWRTKDAVAKIIKMKESEREMDIDHDGKRSLIALHFNAIMSIYGIILRMIIIGEQRKSPNE